MNIDKDVIIKRFGKNANSYDDNAKVQKKMSDNVIRVIEKNIRRMRGCASVLEIGCGTGGLTERLASIFPNVKITAIDIAPGMIDVARRRMNGHENVSFRCSDIETDDMREKYDLIVSNAAVQWFHDTPSTFAKIISMLNASGSFVFSTFGNGTFREMKTSYEMAKENLGVGARNLPVHDYLDMDAVRRIFEDISDVMALENVCSEESMEKYVYPDVKGFLYSLKNIGANSGTCGIRVLREMMRIYDANYSVDGGIEATYHCMYHMYSKE